MQLRSIFRFLYRYTIVIVYRGVRKITTKKNQILFQSKNVFPTGSIFTTDTVSKVLCLLKLLLYFIDNVYIDDDRINLLRLLF